MSSAARILVVDDEDAVTDTFGRMLALEGYTVDAVTSGADGLAHAAEHPPAAIILDLRMPQIDGWAFLERLRATQPLASIPVAIVTGAYLLDDAALKRISDLGARVYFKPVWLEELSDIARTLLQSST